MKEVYKKPLITLNDNLTNIFPAAFATGVSLALARGIIEIDSSHTKTLSTPPKITKVEK